MRPQGTRKVSEAAQLRYATTYRSNGGTVKDVGPNDGEFRTCSERKKHLNMGTQESSFRLQATQQLITIFKDSSASR